MSDTEIKNCDNETVKTDKEQLKHDVRNFLDKNGDKLDKSTVNIIEKFVNDENVNPSEIIYLLLNVFMGNGEFQELKNIILNAKPNGISEPMQQHLKQYNPTEAAKYQQMQELVNIDKDSPDYRRLMEERLLKDIQNMAFTNINCNLSENNQEPEITDNVKEDIHNKFCMVQGFEKEDETDIQRANDPKFTLKVIAMLVIILFTSFFVIGICAMFG